MPTKKQVDHLVSVLDAIAFSRETDPKKLKTAAREAIGEWRINFDGWLEATVVEVDIQERSGVRGGGIDDEKPLLIIYDDYDGNGGITMKEEQIKEYAIKRAEAQENFVACYLKETGLKAEDIALVEYHDGNTIRWWCEPKRRIRIDDE